MHGTYFFLLAWVGLSLPVGIFIGKVIRYGGSNATVSDPSPAPPPSLKEVAD